MKKETAIYPSHRKLLGTTLAAAIMTTLSCLLVIVQPHGKVGLVIGIVGAVFFGGCICILFIVLLKNFFRNRPTLLLTPDSLRIYVPAKGIYITIEWQRIAAYSEPTGRNSSGSNSTIPTGRSTRKKTGLPKGLCAGK